MSSTTAPAATVRRSSAPTRQATRRLGCYLACTTGQQREVLRVARPDGSVLVVDYRLGTLSDGRLVAHLSPQEPVENARIVCDLYLADENRGHCRPIGREDFDCTRNPLTPPAPAASNSLPATTLHDDDGFTFRLDVCPSEQNGPELRWTRSTCPGGEGSLPLTLRSVVGHLQAYEPARALTRQALACSQEGVSSSRLAQELQRVNDAVIVLNRSLREAVQRRVRGGQVSMSEIALRCGRSKRDARGNISGETSWLARRIGLLPESGEPLPCPWIHSDVLALIARDGLGLSPHEVEL